MTKILKNVKALRSLSIRSHFALQAIGHEMIMRVLSDTSTRNFNHVKELYFDRISIQAIISLHLYFEERNYEWLEALKFRIWPVSCQEKNNVTKVVSNLISKNSSLKFLMIEGKLTMQKVNSFSMNKKLRKLILADEVSFD